MPIGKNSIKRAVNNGYSNVKTSAPDMENSEVLAKEEVKVEEVKTPAKKSAKAPAKKTTAAKTAAPAKKTVKKAESKAKDGFIRVEVGGEMPYYLL